MEEPESLLPILTPCSSGRRRRSNDSNSPEFEFWMVRNPSFPQPNLHSADELFSDGVLLPLQLLHHHPPLPPPEASGSDQAPEPETQPEPAELSATPPLTSSKRWRDIIFKKNDKKSSKLSSTNIINGDDHSTKEKDNNNNNNSVKEKKREKKNGGVGVISNGVSAAELNINIWPFSRSRSAGNGGARPRAAAATRKVSSAPCSRSNSGGESKSRKWPSSPGRAGVHLGRNSPVWQVRRSAAAGAVKSGEKGAKKDGNEGRRKVPVVAGGSSKARVLSLNVPMCIGYRPHLSCKMILARHENTTASRREEGSTIHRHGVSYASRSNAAVLPYDRFRQNPKPSALLRPISSPSATYTSIRSKRPSFFTLNFVQAVSSELHKKTYKSEGPRPKAVPELAARTVLAGLLGFGMIDVAFADGDEAAAKPPSPPESAKTPPPPEFAKTPVSPEAPTASSHHNLEEIARREKARLEDLIKSKGVRFGSYPRFTVSVKGQKVTFKFQVPPSCEIPLLITNLVSRLGVRAEDSGVGSDMMLQAWDSGVAWQLTLRRPKTEKGTSGDQIQAKDKLEDEGDLCILMFRPLIGSDKAEIEFMKQGSFTIEELDAFASILHLAGQPKALELRPKGEAARVPTMDKTITSLEGMGVKIYGLNQPNVENPKADISWENIAGYDNQKREIEDTILLALKSPEVYDDIARGTRCKFESNRPRAVLFEGPPGTGKTSCARVISSQAGVPLLYVPLEIIMSKYYGESERLLGKVFSLANEISNGAIVFLDEVDSVATARDNETHEATRRLLSVLLRQIDGFEQEKKVVVIAATNRKQDLDPALISRFDSMIAFGLPDQHTREQIIAQYAKHLTKSDLAELAAVTDEMSGRDIRDVCQQAERHWASKIIRGQAPKTEEQGSLPSLNEYIQSAMKRRTAIHGLADQTRNPNPLSKKPQFDFL
ncbi:hypothetical protein BUALT_Bualt03G0081400 [Buddleja alternifolia]|uniref:AAA+ ATPase domain-containing protein n=1 Tax=Buddleja alternifolia TaxID=168488 RepID=A0AAV6Y391_9LAMI|nr:hypothetical protein BUALT_Bualt03G0081400 [Buddleja alternifolia]